MTTPPNQASHVQPETLRARSRPQSPSSAEPTLRFPRAQANRQLASWISSSDPDIMNPSSLPEDHGLSESYELINSTDGESQDEHDHLSESMSSLSFARPDDMRSLAGTEQTNNTRDAGVERSSASESASSEADDRDDRDEQDEQVSTYIEQSLEHPSSPTPSASRFDATPLNQSIEFKEDEAPAHLKKVSVKHTIREFDEETSASISEKIGIPNPPQRLVGTVRQTMSQAHLSIKGPFRVLYVGSEAGRAEIIHKISTALVASAATPNSGTYNVVPVSDFMKEDPEVHLTRTSEFQIQVELCTSAREISYDGEHFPGDTVYSITVRNGAVGHDSAGDDRTYQSSFCPSGSVVDPKWILPHVAVFYIMENDDEATRQTRDAAWEFMTRHGVPSVFISNSQTFEEPPTGRWRMFVDQHAVHLCLESRDSIPTVPHERLPIDLASFLKIDARQMSRNLAYLTGLHELPAEKKLAREENQSPFAVFVTRASKDIREVASDIAFFYNNMSPLAKQVGLFAVLASLFSMMLATMFRSGIPTLSAGVPSASCSTASTTQPTVTVSLSASTVTVNLTSTKTIRIPQAMSSSSGFAVSTFSAISETTSEGTSKKMVCSTELLGSNEILLKIPLSTKTSWLAKDSIFIDVYRGEDIIKTKFSSVDEGIIIEISKRDAYGVLNVLVTTTRRPKVNETFEVDFGKGLVGEAVDFGSKVARAFSARFFSVAKRASHQAADVTEKAVVGAGSFVESMSSNLQEQVNTASQSLKSGMKDFEAYYSRFAAEAANRVKESYGHVTFAELLRRAQDAAALNNVHAEDLRDVVSRQVLEARVSAKLWWLKVQQKTAEYSEYQRKAEQYLLEMEALAKKASKERLHRAKKEIRARRKKGRFEARCQPGFKRWSKACKKAT